jgi:hypothetical protein
MDKVIKVTAGFLIIILVIFVFVASYNAHVEKSYRESLISMYFYTCTLSTDSQLSNVTFFIPLPATKGGNSGVIERFSAREVGGLPADWKIALIGSSKGTVVEIKTPVINPAHGGVAAKKLTTVLSLTVNSSHLIDTVTPQENESVFRPMQGLVKSDCPDQASGTADRRTCYRYMSPVYADYTASPDTRLEISASITGTNTWKIFEPARNEYHATFDVLLFGEQHGWTTGKGLLETGIGTYNAPEL